MTFNQLELRVISPQENRTTKAGHHPWWMENPVEQEGNASDIRTQFCNNQLSDALLCDLAPGHTGLHEVHMFGGVVTWRGRRRRKKG